MPKGIPRNGHPTRETGRKPRTILTRQQKAAIIAEWDGNVRRLGISAEEQPGWSCSELSWLMREQGMPSQKAIAERYGVGASVVSFLVRRKPHIGGRQRKQQS